MLRRHELQNLMVLLNGDRAQHHGVIWRSGFCLYPYFFLYMSLTVVFTSPPAQEAKSSPLRPCVPHLGMSPHPTQTIPLKFPQVFIFLPLIFQPCLQHSTEGFLHGHHQLLALRFSHQKRLLLASFSGNMKNSLI